MNIVNLDDCRQLLGLIEQIRGTILRGEVSGIQCCIRQPNGRETLHVAGEYRRDRDLSSRTAMKMSWLLQTGDIGVDSVSDSSRR
jgi:hypothetical protein